MTMLADLPRDFRYAARSLRARPGFTVVAVAVLALGIGATSAIFSLVSAVWLKPLPFADEERLVSLWVDLSAIGGPARLEVDARPLRRLAASVRNRSRRWRRSCPVSVNLTGDGGEPERLAGRAHDAESVRDDRLGAAPRPHVRAGRAARARPSSSAKASGCAAWAATPRPSAARSRSTARRMWSSASCRADFRFPYGENDVFIATVFPPELLAEHGVVHLVRRREAARGRVARGGAGRDERHRRGARRREPADRPSPSSSCRCARRSCAAPRSRDVRPTLIGAARRRRARAADRVRQRREPDARARDGAAERARDPQSARRGARPRAAAALDGERACWPASASSSAWVWRRRASAI